MTQFLEEQGHSQSLQADRNKGKYMEAVMSKVEKFMSIRKLQTYFERQSLYVLIDTENFTPNFHYLSYLGILAVRPFKNELYFDLYLLDSNGEYLRARSNHQKTGMPAFVNAISSLSTTSTLMYDSYTCKFKLNTKYTIEQPDKCEVVCEKLQDAFNQLIIHQNLIKKALQFLQLIPEPYNELLHQVQQRMETCRYKLKGSQHEYTPSHHEELHKKHLIQSKGQKMTYNWLWATESRFSLTLLSNKIKQELILNPKAMGVANLTNLQISQPCGQVCKKLQIMLRQESQFPINYGKRIFQDVLLSNQKSTKLEFVLQDSFRVKDELDRIQHLSKSHYLKFVRQYAYLLNLDLPKSLSSKFIIQKDQQLILLDDFLNSNSYISFQTRLRLCLEVISVRYVSINMKKLSPNFASQNIYVANDLSIKLGFISHQQHAIPSQQLAETCYLILYNVRCSANNFKEENGQLRNREWRKIIKSVDDGQSQYQGVSVINFWLKKVLLDAINNVQCQRKEEQKKTKTKMREQCLSRLNTEQSSRGSLNETPLLQNQLEFTQKLLFVVSQAYKTYNEVYLRHTPQIFNRHVEI